MSKRTTTDVNGDTVTLTDRSDIMPGEIGTYVEAEDSDGNKAYGSDDDAISNLPD